MSAGREAAIRERAITERKLPWADVKWLLAELAATREREQALREALERAQAQQGKTLAWLEQNGIVFDGPLGTDPSNWQHVAFSIYTDLCEVETIARTALDATGGQQ